MPVSASGEKLARSSRKMRISSSQSMSSRAKVTSPSASASSASSARPTAAFAASTASGSPRKRVSSRVSPFAIGYGPKFAALSVNVAAGRLSPSKRPTSM